MPTVFWEATISEFLNAVEGFTKARGGNKSDTPTNADLDALLEKYG